MNEYLESVLDDDEINLENAPVYADGIVKDMNTAIWAFKKVKALTDKMDEINKVAKEQIDMINAWKEKEIDKYMNDRAFFEVALKSYYMAEKKKDSRFRLTTPWGHVSSRKQQPELKYDKQQLIAWLKERELTDYIETKEDAKWGEFKKSLKVADGKCISSDGEIIEIIEVHVREDNISVEVE
jgi:hypothetical protein